MVLKYKTRIANVDKDELIKFMTSLGLLHYFSKTSLSITGLEQDLELNIIGEMHER